MPYFRPSTKSYVCVVAALCIVFLWPFITDKTFNIKPSLIKVNMSTSAITVQDKTKIIESWKEVENCRNYFIKQNKTRRTLWSKGYKNPCFRHRLKGASPTSQGPLQCLPYFFVAGFPKCGTTDIFQRMSLHPDFVPPYFKEIHWITRYRFGYQMYKTGLRKQNSSFRTRTLDYGLSMYTKVFDSLAIELEYSLAESNESQPISLATKITGDFSPSTIWDNDVFATLPKNKNYHSIPKYTTADFVWEMNPCAKIIVLMRDPVQRLYSDYIFFRGSRHHPADFHEKVRISVIRYLNCFSLNSVEACLFNASLARISPVRLRVGAYYFYIVEWLKRFPQENFLFLRLEDYAKDVGKSLEEVFKFLQIDHNNKQVITNIKKQSPTNTGPSDALPMLNVTRAILTQFYKPFNVKLAHLLNDKQYLFSSFQN